MKITKVDGLVVKMPYHDRFGGQSRPPEALAGGEYFFESEWKVVHPTIFQAVLVYIETDEGSYGWGECQAPIAPEATCEIISQLLKPMILGSDPRAVNALWDRMYSSMAGRGHITGFMLDAMAGIDIALWDIKGKAAGEPVYRLLGGACRQQLPLYVSGLRSSNAEACAEMACECFDQGYAAIKLYLGRGVANDVAQVQAIRKYVGDQERILTDAQWAYRLPEALKLGRTLEDLGVEWFETPMRVENVRKLAKLANALQIAVADGETLRTRRQFREYLEQEAIDIAQPDIARCGITEGKRIADMADAYDLPVAFHLGLSMGVAIAATWHVAAAIPNFYIQEHHPPLFEQSNRLLRQPLKVDAGQAVIPDRPGLGIDLDREMLEHFTEVSEESTNNLALKPHRVRALSGTGDSFSGDGAAGTLAGS